MSARVVDVNETNKFQQQLLVAYVVRCNIELASVIKAQYDAKLAIETARASALATDKCDVTACADATKNITNACNAFFNLGAKRRECETRLRAARANEKSR